MWPSERSGTDCRSSRTSRLQSNSVPTTPSSSGSRARAIWSRQGLHKAIPCITGLPRLLPTSVLPHRQVVRRDRQGRRLESRGIQPLRTMLEVLYGAGLRVCELLRLDVGSIDLDSGLVRVLGKGSKERIVPVGGEAKATVIRFLRAVRPLLLRDTTTRALWLDRFRESDAKVHLPALGAGLGFRPQASDPCDAVHIPALIRDRVDHPWCESVCGGQASGPRRPSFDRPLREAGRGRAEARPSPVPPQGAGPQVNQILDQLPFPKETILGETRPWIESLCARNCQPGSIHAFWHRTIRLVGQFLQNSHGLRSCRDVRAEHLSDLAGWLLNRGLKVSTRENYFQVTKNYFQWLEKTGRIFESPARALIVPRRPRSLQRVPSEGDIAGLIDGIRGRRPMDDRDRALLEIAYGAGLRVSELSALKLSSVDLDGCIVRVLGKGAKERVVPISANRCHGNTQVSGARQTGASTGPRRRGVTLDWQIRNSTEQERASAAHPHQGPSGEASARSSRPAARICNAPASARDFPSNSEGAPGACEPTPHLREYLRYAPTELQAIHRKSHPGK